MDIIGFLGDMLGIGDQSFDLNTGQFLLRGLIVYIFAVALLRIGDKRFLGKNTAFDVILGIVLGSVLSRAITGNSPMIPTLAVSALLVGLHWILAYFAFQTDHLGNLIKGVPRHLVKDGEPQVSVLRHSHISMNDLHQALRTSQNTDDLATIDQAYLERHGEISFQPKAKTPRVVEIQVIDGVQTVRVELRD